MAPRTLWSCGTAPADVVEAWRLVMAQRRYGTKSTINGPVHKFSKMYHGWYFLPFRGNLQGRKTSNRNQRRCVSYYYPYSRVPPTTACPSHNVSAHVRHAEESTSNGLGDTVMRNPAWNSCSEHRDSTMLDCPKTKAPHFTDSCVSLADEVMLWRCYVLSCTQLCLMRYVKNEWSEADFLARGSLRALGGECVAKCALSLAVLRCDEIAPMRCWYGLRSGKEPDFGCWDATVPCWIGNQNFWVSIPFSMGCSTYATC